MPTQSFDAWANQMRTMLRSANIPATQLAPMPADFDPQACTEEAYVASRWKDGAHPETIRQFYAALAEWGSKSRPSALGQLHPDLDYAANRAGILADGILLIRLYRAEYWHAAAK